MSGIAPYKNDAADFMYNLLFCDDPTLFARGAKENPDSPITAILSDTPDAARIAAIANDTTQESRTRALAFNWLRQHGHDVPKRILLGTILEVPQDAGLDTLAAFADGSARYINQTGRMAVFEGDVPAISATSKALLAASQEIVDKIGPWTKPRLPPPPKNHLRMTFLVSDGLYFGEGPMAEMTRDPLAGKVFQTATQLLVLVTKLPSR